MKNNEVLSKQVFFIASPFKVSNGPCYSIIIQKYSCLQFSRLDSWISKELFHPSEIHTLTRSAAPRCQFEGSSRRRKSKMTQWLGGQELFLRRGKSIWQQHSVVRYSLSDVRLLYWPSSNSNSLLKNILCCVIF